MPTEDNFYLRVFAVVRRIPRGKVATYGQVAALAGTPRAARIVGWALRTQAKKDVPWHRVLNTSGMISIENMNAPKEEQARLLELEGVVIERKAGNLFVDLKKYGWSAIV